MYNTQEIVEQGTHGEHALNSWFQHWRLPHVAICQNPNSFSSLFGQDIKRPDFFLLMPSLGTIAIDAKNYTLSGGVYTLNVAAELRKSIAFERLFRMPLWYAYMDHESNGQRWHWISALKAIEVGDERINKHTNEQFLAIPLSEFVCIETASDLAKLYHHQLPSTTKIAALPLEI